MNLGKFRGYSVDLPSTEVKLNRGFGEPLLCAEWSLSRVFLFTWQLASHLGRSFSGGVCLATVAGNAMGEGYGKIFVGEWGGSALFFAMSFSLDDETGTE